MAIAQRILMCAFMIFLGATPGFSGGGPPVSGSVQNFVVFDKPIPAPLIPLSARAGGEQSLSDYGGKIVVVNFWATWCGPCVREMPTLARLQEKFTGEDFAMVIVSQDRGGWRDTPEAFGLVEYYLNDDGKSGSSL